MALTREEDLNRNEVTLSPEQLIEFNALGPFAHSHYKVNGVEVSHEGVLSGRADYLVDMADLRLQEIGHDLSVDPKKLKVLDVGANDGFVLHQLWERGYHNLTGLEPREHNVMRGRRVRDLLEIPDGVIHHVGSIETVPKSLSGLTFDLVICFGVLHHVVSTPDALASLRRLSEYGLLFESLTLDDNLVTSELREALEAKDVIYLQQHKAVSLIGVKLESDYFPGSAVQSGFVTVPARRALEWMLEFAGFEMKSFEPGWESSLNVDSSLRSSHRSTVNTSLVFAKISISEGMQSLSQVAAYEQAACWGVLGVNTLKDLEITISMTLSDVGSPLEHEIVIDALLFPSGEIETVKGLIHAPKTKLAFEKAKRLIFEGQDIDAIKTLNNLVSNPNDDWRTVYRSFYLLSILDVENAADWREMLKLCNPVFPLAFLDPIPFLLDSQSLDLG